MRFFAYHNIFAPEESLDALQKSDETFFGRKDVVIGENAIFRLDQILVRVKAGVEKCHRHVAACVTFVGVHPHRDW